MFKVRKWSKWPFPSRDRRHKRISIVLRIFQCILVNTWDFVCESSLLLWNSLGRLTIYNIFQVYRKDAVKSGLISAAPRPWYESSSPHPPVEVLLVQVLTHKNREAQESAILLRMESPRYCRSFRKCGVQKERFVSLSYHNFRFEEVRSTFFFKDTEHRTVTAGL